MTELMQEVLYCCFSIFFLIPGHKKLCSFWHILLVPGCSQSNEFRIYPRNFLGTCQWSTGSTLNLLLISLHLICIRRIFDVFLYEDMFLQYWHLGQPPCLGLRSIGRSWIQLRQSYVLFYKLWSFMSCFHYMFFFG